MKYLHLILIAGIIITLGCAIGTDRLKYLEPGMTKAEVYELLGRPDGYDKSYNYETLHYLDVRYHGYVKLRDGKVVRWDRDPRGDFSVGAGAGAVTVIPINPNE